MLRKTVCEIMEDVLKGDFEEQLASWSGAAGSARTDAQWSGPLSWRPIFATVYSHLSPPISDMIPSESCIYCTANSEGVMYFRAEWILRWL